jgi:hypothetical protein
MSIVNTLSQAEQIEYYFGKDRYPNLFFQSRIPDALEIPGSRREFTGGIQWADCRNTTITHDGIEYQFNNLGYRSHYDYHVDELKNKKNILCVGDSDIFAPYKHYNDIWTTRLQTFMPEHNILTLGLPGWAGDTVSRSTVSTIKALGSSIDHVCVIWPQDNRREFIKKDFKKITGNGEAPTDIPFEDYWDQIDWVSNNYNYYKNRELVEFACRANGSGFTDLLIVTIGKYVKFDGERFGKGVMGIKSHEALCNWFYKKINGLPSLYETLKKK